MFEFYFQMSGPKFPIGVMINEMFVLAFLVVVESVRLLLGQKHEPVSMIFYTRSYLQNYFNFHVCPSKPVHCKYLHLNYKKLRYKLLLNKSIHFVIVWKNINDYWKLLARKFSVYNIFEHLLSLLYQFLEFFIKKTSSSFDSRHAAINLQIFFQFQVDFDTKMSAIFRILVLTVPSTYSVVYFTFWQTFVTRLDAALGMIMLLIQVMQFFSAILCWWPKVPSIKQTLKRPTSPTPYSRL